MAPLNLLNRALLCFHLMVPEDAGCSAVVYETLDCSGESRRFENLDQVEDFLVKREQSGA